MAQSKNHKFLTGFTLIELLVVIAIIGLLAAIVLVSLNGARTKARDVQWKANKVQIIKALQLYYNDNPGVGWPASGGNWVCFGAPSSEKCWNNGYNGLDSLVVSMQSYLPSMPVTNATSGSYAYNRFLYLSSGTISGQTGAFLIWPKENTMTASECPSARPPNHYDEYWYCYEFVGPP